MSTTLQTLLANLQAVGLLVDAGALDAAGARLAAHDDLVRRFSNERPRDMTACWRELMAAQGMLALKLGAASDELSRRAAIARRSHRAACSYMEGGR